MRVEVKFEKLKESQAKLTIKLDKKELEGYMSEAEQLTSRQVSVKGFRKGKAPKNLVRGKVGEEYLRQEALDIALRRSLQRTLFERELDVLKTLELKILKNTTDSFSYEVKFQLFPQTELGEYKGIELERRRQKVSDEDVESTLSYIQKSKATYTKSDSPVQKGDRVEVDFVVTRDGKTIEGGESKNHPLVVGQGGFLPGFEDALMGMVKGQHKDVLIKVPADYYQKAIAGADLEVKIDIKMIEHMDVPEIDDAFAKSLGNFSSLSELKKSIAEGISSEKEEKEKERIRGALLEKVAEKAKMDVPESMVEEQLDRMVDEFDESLRRQGMEMGLYLAHIKKTKEELRREWRVQAEKQVRLTLTMRAVAKKENIKVDDDEVKDAVNGTLKNYRTVEEAAREVSLDGLFEKMQGALLRQKVFQFLEENAKIIDVK